MMSDAETQASDRAGLGTPAWVALLAICALALALRWIGLGRQSLWVDEAFSYQYAKPDSSLSIADFFGNLHGPLHALLLHYWMKLFGHSEAAVRFPSLLASLASLVAFWCFARRAWGMKIAWAGALLLAVAPFHIWYAQECRNYALLILFAVLAEWAYHRITHEAPRARHYAAYGLALLGGFLSNLSMAFFLLQHVARFLLVDRAAAPGRLRPVRTMLLTWALVGVCLLPWGISFYRHQVAPSHLLTTEAVPEQERLREETTASPLGIPYTFYSFATGYSFGPATRDLWRLGPAEAVRENAVRIAFAAAVFGLLWLAGLRALWREDRRGAWGLIIWQLLPLVALLFIAWRNVKVINPRYVATMYPAFMLTLAWGLMAGGRRSGAAADAEPHAGSDEEQPGSSPGQGRQRAAQVVYLLAIAISLISVARGLMLEKYHKEDYRDAASYLLREMRPGDAFVSLAVDLPMRNYYMRDELRAVRPIPWEDIGKLVNWKGTITLKGRGPESYEQVFLRAWRPGRRLFVLLAREWVTDPGGAIERDLRAEGTLIAAPAWTGVRVLVLERRPSGPRLDEIAPDAQASRGHDPSADPPADPSVVTIGVPA
jgi:hypothetical protein